MKKLILAVTFCLIATTAYAADVSLTSKHRIKVVLEMLSEILQSNLTPPVYTSIHETPFLDPFPDDLELIVQPLDGPVLVLDLRTGKTSKRRNRYALVNALKETALQFEAVERVKVLINGAALFVILFFMVKNGIGAINWTFLTQPPMDSMTRGGILPCIVGTACLGIGAILIALPIVILFMFTRKIFLQAMVEGALKG